MTHFKNKSFYVYGMGKTGAASVHFLLSEKAIVSYGDDCHENTEPIEGATLINYNNLDFCTIDYLVLSPGIQILKGHEHPVYLKAKDANCQIISDIDILYLANPNAKYIGITGTNGKSTTTALIYKILKEAGLPAYIGGNFGIAALALPIDTKGVYVIEISSYQLELSSFIKFDVSLFINFEPHHLDRHGTSENYFAAKEKIFVLQKESGLKLYSPDYLFTKIINSKFANTISISRIENNADYYLDKNIMLDKNSNQHINLADYCNIPGNHNFENIAFAYATCRVFGLPSKTILQSINTFKGLEHRIEFVGSTPTLTFINDSKATNAIAAEKALAIFDNVIWILGGQPKEDGIASLKKFKNKIVEAYLIGDAQEQFALELDSWHASYKKAGTLDKVIELISRRVYPSGTIVLLSPACASWDQYANFEERGKHFKNLIKKHFKLNE